MHFPFYSVLSYCIVASATKLSCYHIINCHNHPAGTANPSCHDDNLTKKIKSACEIMDIRVLDHVIVTPDDSYYSYCDEGRLKNMFKSIKNILG
ncbi:MAG: hypothetical protein K2L45_02205 [Muribaculaceae bacterium]|nr:hypothetical protein [Muribaculaceae bacterium]